MRSLTGAFINPNMSFDEMKSLVIAQMGKMNLPADIIQKSIKSLPDLKRWRNVQEIF